MGSRAAAAAAALLAVAVAAGCAGDEEAPRSPQTRAVEERAGDFLEYYGEVLRLARRYAAFPDSFRVALDSLPGSHLSEEEWDAWVAPYRDDPGELAARLEEILAELARRK